MSALKNSEKSGSDRGIMGISVLKTAGIKAEKAVNNQYFEGILDTSDEWIVTRTGISERRFVRDENTMEMALGVARQLGDSVIGRDIRLILHASFSPDLIVPSIAAKIQLELGLQPDMLCADINIGCAGFVGALIIAERYLRPGECGMVVASETISDYLDFSDRTTAILFGDGAAGILFEKTEGGMFFADVKTYGNDEDLFMKKGGKVSMRGNNVYRFAIDKVPLSVETVLEKSGLSKDDIDHVLCHQANIRIIEQICKRTGISEEKFHHNLERYGNTSAASVPLLWNELAEGGALKRRDRLLLTAFGAGLTVSSVVMEWQ